MTKERVLSQILSSDALPTLPAVASKVLALSAEDDTDIQQIAQVIGQDVSLSSKILRVVNSPIYGFSTPIGTISKAVAVMGTNPVRSLVLSFSLIDLDKSGEDFDYNRFWERSLTTAVSARLLLMEIGEGAPEEGFIAGLFQNLGEILLARVFPRQMDDINRQVVDHDMSLVEVERRVLGIDHTLVGSEVARSWRLPAQIVEPLRYHHNPGEYLGSSGSLRTLVQVSHLGSLLAEAFFSSRPQEYRDAFVRKAGDLFGLDEPTCQALASRVHEEVNLAARYFGLNLHLARSLEDILQEANLRLGAINLSYEQMTRELVQARGELSRVNQELQEKTESLERLANVDGLTEVYNYRFFQVFLRSEFSRAVRLDHPLSLILADIDDFKKINDQFGHQAGDSVLRELCRVARRAVRDYDLLARYGGEEFVFVLPETDLEEARELADRIRQEIADHEFYFQQNTHRITFSMGVAAIRPALDKRDAESLVKAADLSLLQAKRQGKNRVVSLSQQEGSDLFGQADF